MFTRLYLLWCIHVCIFCDVYTFVSSVVFTVAMFSFSVVSTLWCVHAFIFCDVYMHELVFFCGNYLYFLAVLFMCLLFMFIICVFVFSVPYCLSVLG